MDKVALEDGGVFYTKRRIDDDAILLAKALVTLGHAEEETLTICMKNLFEGVVLTFAANAIGLKVAYGNYQGSLELLVEEMNEHESTALAVFDRDAEFAEGMFKRVPTLRSIINIEPPGKTGETVGMISLGRTFVSYDGIRRQAKNHFQGSIRARLARNTFSKKERIFLQTSGSTAVRPKCLPFTNENIFAMLMYAKNSTGTKTHDKTVAKVLCILSYRHPYGWMTMFVNLLGGNRVVLAKGYSAEEIGKWYRDKPSYIYGTPQFLRQFMAETPEKADLSFLRAFFCAGMETPEELFEEAGEYFLKHNSGAEVRNNYGIGETLCVGTASDGVPHRAGTSGKFYVGPEWVIVDEDLNEVPYGTVGELLVRSKSMISRYFNNPEETKNSFIKFRGKTFFRTGDFVSLAEDGYVTFHGRKKRFYQPKDSNDKVNCETIEKALLGAKEIVLETAVEIYQLPDKSNSSCAFIVLESGVEKSDETREKLFDFLRTKIRPFEMPTKIEFLDELPLMASGKVNHKFLESLLKS